MKIRNFEPKAIRYSMRPSLVTLRTAILAACDRYRMSRHIRSACLMAFDQYDAETQWQLDEVQSNFRTMKAFILDALEEHAGIDDLRLAITRALETFGMTLVR